MKVVKVPFVTGHDSVGSVLAPGEIIEGLKEVYTNSSLKEINSESFLVDDISLSSNLEESNEFIYRSAFLEYSKNSRVCFLGGDHSMSYSTTRAFLDYCENSSKVPALIVFDAHLDLMMPSNRLVPFQEEWLRGLIEDGFPIENILVIGVRNPEISEIEFSRGRLRKVSILNFLSDLDSKVDAIMEFGYKKEVYLSIDFDCIDPAYAPGVNYPEPAGFSSKEFLYIMNRLSKMKNLKAFDIVEINPKKDLNRITTKFASKILAEFL